MAGKQRAADRWREVVDDWVASGQSRKEYAEAHDLNPKTLGWWKWKLGQQEPAEEPEPDTPAFVDVVVTDADPEPDADAPDFVVEVGTLRVHVPCGFDAGELRRLVGALC